MQRRQLGDKSVNLVIQIAVLPSARLQHVAARSVCRVVACVQCKPSSTRALVRTYAVQWPLCQHTPRHLVNTPTTELTDNQEVDTSLVSNISVNGICI